jgi:hypothetical protein
MNLSARSLFRTLVAAAVKQFFMNNVSPSFTFITQFQASFSGAVFRGSLPTFSNPPPPAPY